jgi:hypothetical protein
VGRVTAPTICSPVEVVTVMHTHSVMPTHFDNRSNTTLADSMHKHIHQAYAPRLLWLSAIVATHSRRMRSTCSAGSPRTTRRLQTPSNASEFLRFCAACGRAVGWVEP